MSPKASSFVLPMRDPWGSLRGFPLEIDPGQPRAHRKSFYGLVFNLTAELHFPGSVVASTGNCLHIQPKWNQGKPRLKARRTKTKALAWLSQESILHFWLRPAYSMLFITQSSLHLASTPPTRKLSNLAPTHIHFFLCGVNYSTGFPGMPLPTTLSISLHAAKVTTRNPFLTVPTLSTFVSWFLMQSVA